MKKKVKKSILLPIAFLALILVFALFFNFYIKKIFPSPFCSEVRAGNLNDFYVDNSGKCGVCNDNNPGTINQPWCTIQKAARTLNPGQTVYVREGVYREMVTLTKSGNETSRIIFRNYPGENPILKGSEVASNWSLYKGNTWKTANLTPIAHDYWEDQVGFLHRKEGVYQNNLALVQAREMCDKEYSQVPGAILDLKMDGIQNGNASDSSSSKFDAKANGNLKVAQGIKGNGFEFDGESYLDFGNIDLNLGEEYTISYWYKTPKRNDKKMFLFYTNFLKSTPIFSYLNIQTPTFNWNNGAVELATGADNNVNAWYNLVIVVNKTNMRIYPFGLDSFRMYEKNITVILPEKSANPQTFIGKSYNAPNISGFIGIIDEFKIYRKALSYNDARQNYLSSLCGSEPLEEGMFFVDDSTNITYAHFYNNSNPNNEFIEANKRGIGIYASPSSNLSYVSIIGFDISQFAGQLQNGAIHIISNLSLWIDEKKPITTGIIIENNIVEWNNGAGILIRGKDNIIRNNVIMYNGQLGFGGGGINSLWENNVVMYNNRKNMPWGNEAGGGKLAKMKDSIVRGFNAAFNNGPGIWLDADNDGNILENNIAHDNIGPGIMLEISGNAKPNIIRNNIAYNNLLSGGYAGSGIFLQGSRNTPIYNNLVFNNEQYGIWMHSGAGRMEFGQKQTNSNNFAFNNIILNNTRGQLVIDKDTANMPDWNFNNTGEDNIYSGKKYLETSASFECFQNAPDADSKWLDNPKSLFEDYENMNFLPATNSILINRGKNADLKNDFLGCYRTDGQIDIGPFELGECLKCGDSICSELYETNVSCPRDCLKFSETCSSLGYECGFHIVNGEEVNCGDCEEPCEGDNCTPICSDSCSSLGYECGVQEICGQEIDCGGCEGACIEGKCQNRVCTETCSSLGYECGVQEICGQQVDCGDCEEKPLPQEDNTLFIILISILSILIILIISFLIRKYHIFGL